MMCLVARSHSSILFTSLVRPVIELSLVNYILTTSIVLLWCSYSGSSISGQAPLFDGAAFDGAVSPLSCNIHSVSHPTYLTSSDSFFMSC